jgi:hypothetical protein
MQDSVKTLKSRFALFCLEKERKRKNVPPLSCGAVRKNASIVRVNSVTPILDVAYLTCKLTVREIDSQLDWHRRNGNPWKIPKRKLKADKLKALVDAVVSYHERHE